ncbi:MULTISPECIES: SH3 domain-containing protein [unclassified Sphingomonas]|uniref:SH3 domain-containing protein n=1 Tax=unclassified Sphingomonas TaxID=196159 RepID=UPI001F576902|nr:MULTISPECIES: SH3 domain-containing protein [unclassified Sphingomonas]
MLGQSVALDPRQYAVRRDLADIRLADRVFAPHYAAAVLRVVVTATELREKPETDSAVIADLPEGAPFEVLEFVAGRAWGSAPSVNLVGYVDTRALSWPTS